MVLYIVMVETRRASSLLAVIAATFPCLRLMEAIAFVEAKARLLPCNVKVAKQELCF
jgi:hypothetical protein